MNTSDTHWRHTVIDADALAKNFYCINACDVDGDGRFEHHDGCRLADLGHGRRTLHSHGWQDSLYVHPWDWRLSGQGIS